MILLNEIIFIKTLIGKNFRPFALIKNQFKFFKKYMEEPIFNYIIHTCIHSYIIREYNQPFSQSYKVI